MTTEQVRLGLIYPTGGGDHEFYQFAEAMDDRIRVLLVTARLMGGETDHAVEALLETARLDYLEAAARRLSTLRPDAAIWACTSGSFIVGRAGATAQAEAIGRVAGCPASSTSIAFVNALESLGLARVAVMATYPEAVARHFESFLNAWDIEVANLRWLDIPSGWFAGLVEAEELEAAVRAADHPAAEAVLVPDTALPTLSVIDRLEQAVGKPVLTANQVTLWEGLNLAGAHLAGPGWGRLLAA